jgi:magnesium transporter
MTESEDLAAASGSGAANGTGKTRPDSTPPGPASPSEASSSEASSTVDVTEHATEHVTDAPDVAGPIKTGVTATTRANRPVAARGGVAPAGSAGRIAGTPGGGPGRAGTSPSGVAHAPGGVGASSTHPAGAGGIGRALAGPVRAMTRIFTQTSGTGGDAVGGSHGGPTSIVDCGLYVNGARQPGEWGFAQALAAARKRHAAFVWLGVHEPGEAEFAEIASVFELDEFAVEDAVVGTGRAKIERSGDTAFLVLRTARYVEHQELTETSEVVETGDIMIFVGGDFVITVRHGDVSSLRSVRVDLENQPELMQLGPWAVVYAICDRIVDSYLDVAGMVEIDIDEVEAHVFSRQAHSRIQRIYQLKRELVEFKRAVVPLQRPLLMLVEGRLGVSAEISRYFRDVHENLVKTVEQVMSFDDLLNSILQARLAQVTVDQNNDMRKIAAWAAIAAMQTAIAGIYGMNFANMPELTWRFGYPIILIIMLGSAIALYLLFRRSGWL